MKLVGLVFAVATLSMGFAFRPELAQSAWFWAAATIPYSALAALAVYRMWDRGTLSERIKPRWGDLSLGALIAIVLLLFSWGARALLTPAGSERQVWIHLLYLQIGPSEALQSSVVLTAVILMVPVFEELVWRGMVQDELGARLGPRRAWPLTALLYGLSMSPTLFTLAAPVAGPNPLLVIGATGCGLFWSFMAAMVGRLPPVIVSHMVFTYFSAAQFRWPGL